MAKKNNNKCHTFYLLFYSVASSVTSCGTCVPKATPSKKKNEISIVDRKWSQNPRFSRLSSVDFGENLFYFVLDICR